MKWIVGVDEVGRGPLAGPVYVCAVAMPLARYKKMRWARSGKRLGDSKKMSPFARELWEREARVTHKDGVLRIAVSSASASMIDKRGIAVCIRACVARAINRLGIKEQECLVLLDGSLKAPVQYKKQQTVIRGDDKHKIISLASVIAKVRRDAYMKKVHQEFPYYAWEMNKGYGTTGHVKAILRRGASALHRKTFLTRIDK